MDFVGLGIPTPTPNQSYTAGIEQLPKGSSAETEKYLRIYRDSFLAFFCFTLYFDACTQATDFLWGCTPHPPFKLIFIAMCVHFSAITFSFSVRGGRGIPPPL